MFCRICGEEFSPTKNHPGYINVCLESECRTKAREPNVIIDQEEIDIALVLGNKS